MQHWFTLHTKPNAEYQVAATLNRRGLETYLPEYRAGRSAASSQTKPFFPCYLFVKLDLDEVGISTVRWTPGLRRIIAFDDQPLPLPDEAIEFIKRRLESGMYDDLPRQRFQPGEPVRIIDGPFAGMEAIFERATNPAERVQVLLTLLGRVNRVSVELADLSPAPADSQEQSPEPAAKRPRRTRGHGRQVNYGTGIKE